MCARVFRRWENTPERPAYFPRAPLSHAGILAKNSHTHCSSCLGGLLAVRVWLAAGRIASQRRCIHRAYHTTLRRTSGSLDLSAYIHLKRLVPRDNKICTGGKGWRDGRFDRLLGACTRILRLLYQRADGAEDFGSGHKRRSCLKVIRHINKHHGGSVLSTSGNIDTLTTSTTTTTSRIHRTHRRAYIAPSTSRAPRAHPLVRPKSHVLLLPTLTHLPLAARLHRRLPGLPIQPLLHPRPGLRLARLSPAPLRRARSRGVRHHDTWLRMATRTSPERSTGSLPKRKWRDGRELECGSLGRRWRHVWRTRTH